MIREEIKQIIKKAIKDLQKEGEFPKFDLSEILVEKQKEKEHGDYSTNIALKLAKITKENPEKIAKKIESLISNFKPEFFQKIEIVNGFINFFISQEYLQNQVKKILKEKEKYGNLKIGRNEKVNLEFISANPTGPLTLGNGRGGFCGDVLANILEKAGYKIKKEYYINDVGEQIKKLGHSVLGDKQAVYKGEYINTLRKKLLQDSTLRYSAEKIGKKAGKIILEKMIKSSIKKMGIKFDVWFKESYLYEKKEVDKVIEEIKKKGFIYTSEGAIWFKCKELGDDKDRVLVRKDGVKTYFASDIAYLKNKFKRGFNKLFFLVGADHHGYINRLKAGAEALGFEKEKIIVIVMQLVRLFEDGKEKKMSKRAGTYITIDELIDKVGLDATRFFFLSRSVNTHLNFDINLAKKRTKENPVYYVQYAYARISSILRKAQKNFKFQILSSNFKLLKEPSELNLIKQFIRLSEIIEDTSKDYQVQRLPQYALDLADAFHKFYENCRVIDEENKNLAQARLSLILATKIVLKKVFDLMGISAPKEM